MRLLRNRQPRQPEDINNAALRFASSMPAKVWLNGELILTLTKADKDLKLDKDAVSGIALKKGSNRLVVKCLAPKGEDSRSFMLRFASASSTPLSFSTRWNILGPIQTQNDSASLAAQLQTEYISDEKALDGTQNAPDGATWSIKFFNESAQPYFIDLSNIHGNGQCAYYATACLDSRRTSTMFPSASLAAPPQKSGLTES